MIDPASTAVGTIAKLAFDAFIKSGAGEISKQSVGGGIKLVKTLSNKIRSKFQSNERAKIELTRLEEHRTQEALNKVSPYLKLEMMEDQKFGEEVRQIAHQVIHILNQTHNQIERRFLQRLDGRYQFMHLLVQD